jgi:hypothetical protein
MRAPRSRSAVVAAAGLVTGVALALGVVHARRGAPAAPTEAGPASLGGAPLPEDRGALDEIVVHYVPAFEPLFGEAYRDFLGSLDPSTRLVVVVPRPDPDAGAGPAPADALRDFLAHVDPSGALARRARTVEVDGPISIWSKDRALVLAPAGADRRSTLVVPVKPDPAWRERANDWRTPAALAAAEPERFTVREVPLDFDAGDFAVTGERVVVDVNLLAKNRRHGVESVGALRGLLARWLGREVVVLGAVDGDVPRHHLSMYMTPAGDGTVLVGDPEAGAALVGRDFAPGEASPETGLPLRADLSPATVQRFERAAADLARAGFRVVRIPTVAFDDKTYLAYTNGVYETRAGRRTAWMPVFGVARLDEAARRTYEALGWQVRPVSARAAYPYHGTIGCLANVLARSN